jgi:hypothetical protein
MRDGIKYHRPKLKFFLAGEEVTEEEYRAAYPLGTAGRFHYLNGAILSAEEYFAVHPVEGDGGKRASSFVAFKPMTSLALKVHPSQVEEAREFARRKGVPTDYQPDGRPVITSSRQFRRLAAIQGFRHLEY